MTHPYNRECAEVNHIQKWVSIALWLLPGLLLQIKRIENDAEVSWKTAVFLIKSPCTVQPHQRPRTRDPDQACGGFGKRRVQRRGQELSLAAVTRTHAQGTEGCLLPAAHRARCLYRPRVSGQLRVRSRRRGACSGTGAPRAGSILRTSAQQRRDHVQPQLRATVQTQSKEKLSFPTSLGCGEPTRGLK